MVDTSTLFGLTAAVIANDRAAAAAPTKALRFAADIFYPDDKSTGAVSGQRPLGGVPLLPHERQDRFGGEPNALDIAAVHEGELRPATLGALPPPAVACCRFLGPIQGARPDSGKGGSGVADVLLSEGTEFLVDKGALRIAVNHRRQRGD